MAIIATYKDTNCVVKNAYIRVGRIWGSKNEGWNCWVEVFNREGDTQTSAPTFSVNAPYVDGENPFAALYRAIEACSFIETEPKEDVASEPVITEQVDAIVDNIVAAVEDKPTKKPGKKKAS